MNDQEYEEILNDIGKYIVLGKDGNNSNNLPSKSIILSGSFNPLHDGHIKLLNVAKSITNLNPFFEISISNVDKKNINLNNLNYRINQFTNVGNLIITNSPTFEDKSNIFKESIFVIGYDTALRVMDKKYYKKDIKKSLEIIINNYCKFLVAGRSINNNYKNLEDIDLPDIYKDLFINLPQEKFRADLSSTELREN